MTKLERQMLKDFAFARRLLGKGSPFDLGAASYPRAPGDKQLPLCGVAAVLSSRRACLCKPYRIVPRRNWPNPTRRLNQNRDASSIGITKSSIPGDYRFGRHGAVRSCYPADYHRLARIHSSVTPALQDVRQIDFHSLFA